MRITTVVALVAVATLLAGPSYAENAYIGLSRATPGEAYANFSTAMQVRNYNSPFAMKLYGGIDLTDRYGIEVGYGAFGTWKIANPASGSSDEVRMSPKLLYAAGKATMSVSDSFALFGKLGLAANKITIENSELQTTSNVSFVRPMLGFGTNYNITKNMAAVLEFNYYGTAGNNFKQQKLELGLKYAF